MKFSLAEKKYKRQLLKGYGSGKIFIVTFYLNKQDGTESIGLEIS